MLFVRALGRAPASLLARHTISSRLVPAARCLRIEAQHQHQQSLLRSVRLQSTSTKDAEAGAASKPAPTKYRFRTKFTIYHAGSGRISFLACLKITTLFIFAFFGFVVTPAYYQKEGLSPTVARTAVCAVVPLVFVAYITSPFVLFMHLRLPPSVQKSEPLARRYLDTFVKTMPPQAELEITTMSLIGKPRVSVVRLSELRPTNKRLGIVNVTRDTTAENAARKWYRFPAVGNFNVRETPNSPFMWDSIWPQLLAKYR